MARIKLALPKEFIFETEIQLRISDINYGGHLGNDSVLSLAHEARMRCLKQHGFSETDCGGAGTIMTDSAIVYKSQGYYGDMILVKVAVEDFSSFGFDFVYQLVNKDSGNEVARVKTGMAFFDYNKGRIAKVPEKFLEVFGG